MIALDGSDSTWLVYADWLEESERIESAAQVRDDLAQETVQAWQYEWRRGVVGVGGGVGGGGVVVGGVVGGVVGVVVGGVVGGGVVGVVGGGVVGGGVGGVVGGGVGGGL